MTYKLSTASKCAIYAAFAGLFILLYKILNGTSENLQMDFNELNASDGKEASVLDANLEDRDLSQYGNISHMFDVSKLDNMGADGQTVRDYEGAVTKWDNSDVVESVMERGAGEHQPMEARSNDFYDVSDIHADKMFTIDEASSGKDALYSESTVVLSDAGLNADEKLARRQKHRGDINKKATDGRVRSTANLFRKFFQNELDENEKRVWWSAESRDVDTDFM